MSTTRSASQSLGPEDLTPEDLTPEAPGRGDWAFESLEPARERLRLWFEFQALPVWCAMGMDHQGWGFHDALDFDGHPASDLRRLRVQARQSIVFAWAGLCGWPGPWRQAVMVGLDAVLKHFRRSDDLFRYSVAADGAVVSDTAYLYEQAFVLLMFATILRACPEQKEIEGHARALLSRLSAFRDPGGELFELEAPGRTTNPLMHLFESSLAWLETPGVDHGAWERLADDIAETVLGRALGPDRPFILEHYDADWGIEDDRFEISPGHQCEWGWLLLRWGRLRGTDAPLEAARLLLNAGERGMDPQRGVLVAALDAHQRTMNPEARLWPQTERLKLARALGDSRIALSAAKAIGRYLGSAPPGLWSERCEADGRFRQEPSPASSFYHIAGAILSL